MTGKAVYNQQCVNVYITREEFLELLANEEVYVQLMIGKEEIPGAQGYVLFNEPAMDFLRAQVKRERAAIAEVRATLPEASITHRRKKRAKGYEHGAP